MANIFKISGYYVDCNHDYTSDDIETLLGQAFDLIDLHIKVEEKDIGEWKDDNPLNRCNCPESECEKYFKEGNTK